MCDIAEAMIQLPWLHSLCYADGISVEAKEHSAKISMAFAMFGFVAEDDGSAK